MARVARRLGRLDPDRARRRDVRGPPAEARPVRPGDRALLGRLHAPGAQHPQRRGERRARDLHRADGAARRPRGQRPRAPDGAARRDARQRRRADTSGGGSRRPSQDARGRARGRERSCSPTERDSRRTGSSSPSPPTESAALLGEPDPGTRGLADRQRPPALRPEAARPAARRAAREPGPLDLRPRAADRPRAGAGPVPDRRRERRPRPGRHARARARRADGARGDRAPRRRRAPLVARQPRAGGDVRRSSRPGGAPAGAGDGTARRRARGRVDRRPGGPRRWRVRSAAAAGRPRCSADAPGTVRSRADAGGFVGVHEAERAQAQTERQGAAASELDGALEAAVGRLLELQTPGGWWVGELESNVTMTAQHVFLLHFLRLLDDRTLQGCANELLARQRPDGTWAIYWGGEPDLAATVEAYTALRLAGLEADDPRLAGARAFVLERGGVGASRVFTRMWLALLGQWRWEDIPQIPVELIFLRSWMPFSVYDFACWARQTLVPLAVVMHYRPVRPVAAERRCDELNLGVSTCAPRAARAGRQPDHALPERRREARARAGARARRALDPRPAGARRLVGRDPAAVGVVARRARLPRPRPRLAVPPPRDRRLAAVHGRGRRPDPARGVPVARLGHGPRRARAARGRRRGRRPGPAAGGPVAARRGGARPGRLVAAPPGRAGRRLVVRVRQRPLPGR